MAAPQTALEPRSPWIAAAQSPAGRMWAAAFAAVALYPGFGWLALLFAAGVAAASFRPGMRRQIFTWVAIAVCVRNLAPHFSGAAAGAPAERASLAALGLLAAWAAGLALWTRLGPRRRAIPRLHAMLLAAIGGLWMLRRGGALAGTTAGALCLLVPELMWRTAYWIKWRARQGAAPRVFANLFTALPFVGAGGVPVGKGPAFLASYEARDSKQLAMAQIEGARLLALALIWRAADALMSGVLLSQKSPWAPDWACPVRPWLPTMANLEQIPYLYPLWQRWAGLYVELFHAILALAVFSHTAVGIFCLMGFRIPRNMQAPLGSTTIVDFWGRYYFYFKELLMDFWFFPAFVRLTRLSVFWRTMLATVAAAFAGNLYYHVVLYSPAAVRGDVHGFRELVLTRAIYCALLAAGLCASFARRLRRKANGQPAGRVRRTLQRVAVATFFAVIHVWNFTGVSLQSGERWQLWRSLAAMGKPVQPGGFGIPGAR